MLILIKVPNLEIKKFSAFFSWILLFRLISCAADYDLEQKLQWQNYAYGGYAWSKLAGITNPAPDIFANVAPGDTDDSSLSNAPFFGLAVHHGLTNWCTIGVCYEIYAVFNYQKYHLNGNPMQEGIGPNYVREFLMNHQAVMLETYLKPPKSVCWSTNNLVIAPQAGVGFGVGINNLFSVATISYLPDSGNTGYTSIAQNHISKSFAWHIELGLNLASLNSNFSFGASYRYDYGGKFKTGTLYEFSRGPNGLNYLPAWNGQLKTNQVKLYINVNFD